MAPETRLGKKSADESDPALLAHIKSLSLETIEEYVAWCACHGFSRRTTKTSHQRLKERSFATRAAAEVRLAQKKHELRNPEKIIGSILPEARLEERCRHAATPESNLPSLPIGDFLPSNPTSVPRPPASRHQASRPVRLSAGDLPVRAASWEHLRRGVAGDGAPRR